MICVDDSLASDLRGVYSLLPNGKEMYGQHFQTNPTLTHQSNAKDPIGLSLSSPLAKRCMTNIFKPIQLCQINQMQKTQVV
jgi:hypothetical protein